MRHATLDTPFAVKILKVTLPSLQERLIIEGQAQDFLQHPNVVKVTDVVKVDGFPALVMEFIDGIAMDDYLNEEKPSTKYAEELFLQILRCGRGSTRAWNYSSRLEACKRDDATHTQQDDSKSL